MATKATLLSTLVTKITAVVGTTKHREANVEMVNEFYPDAEVDTLVSNGNNISPVSAKLDDMDLKSTKQGRIAVINGTFKFNGTPLTNNEEVFEFDNEEMNGSGFLTALTTSGLACILRVDGNKMKIVGSFASYSRLYISNGTYTVTQ